MFYTVLLILACCELIRRVRTFVKENAVVKDGKPAEIASGAFVSLGMSVLFYVMVLAICFLPSMLFR